LLDPDPHSNCGSGYRRAKMTLKNRKKSRIFKFLCTGCNLLRAEGFSCSFGFLYGGLWISKLQFFIQKIEIFFPFLDHQTLVQDPGSGSAIRKNSGSGSALNQYGSENLFWDIRIR
jgi:hypothetical protein